MKGLTFLRRKNWDNKRPYYTIGITPGERFMKITRSLFFGVVLCYVTLFCPLNTAAVECLRPPLPEALDALTSSSTVEVSRVEVNSWDGTTPAPVDDNIYFAFVPKKTVATVGFIILPGGNCDPRSYAPAAHAIAAKGFFTCIIPMPQCVAMFGYLRADRVISDYDKIKKWVIGGHSVGGTAAGVYARNTTTISGVVIWASFMDEANRLDTTPLKVLSVSGSLDGRATPELVTAAAIYLPADTVFVEIQGGNHTQFGWIDTSPYPCLEIDNPATITIEEQQKQIVEATTNFLKQFDQNKCPIAYLLEKEDSRVKTVRKFRDEFLAKSASGQDIISWYQQRGEAIIEIFKKHPVIKNAARILVEVIIIPTIEFFYYEIKSYSSNIAGC